MPMIDDVAESLVSKSQDSGCPSDASTGFFEGVPNQFALPLVYLPSFILRLFWLELAACREETWKGLSYVTIFAAITLSLN